MRILPEVKNELQNKTKWCLVLQTAELKTSSPWCSYTLNVLENIEK